MHCLKLTEQATVVPSKQNLLTCIALQMTTSIFKQSALRSQFFGVGHLKGSCQGLQDAAVSEVLKSQWQAARRPQPAQELAMHGRDTISQHPGALQGSVLGLMTTHVRGGSHSDGRQEEGSSQPNGKLAVVPRALPLHVVTPPLLARLYLLPLPAPMLSFEGFEGQESQRPP